MNDEGKKFIALKVALETGIDAIITMAEQQRETIDLLAGELLAKYPPKETTPL